MNIFTIMFAAIFSENLVFTLCFGASLFGWATEKPGKALYSGLLVTALTTASGIVNRALYTWVLVPLKLEFLKIPAYLIVIGVLVFAADTIVRRAFPKARHLFLEKPEYMLLTANCMVLGSVLSADINRYTFIESAVYGLSAGLGFTLAVLVFAGVRARMQFSDAPEAFKGIPVYLIAAALVIMAFSGFFGVSFT